MVPETEDYTIAPDIARWVLTHRVRDMKVDADSIHRQNGLNLSVGVHKAGALLWGSLASCGRLAIGRTQRVPPAFAPDSGGSQPPRRLPACPTSRQRFHSYVVHRARRANPSRTEQIAQHEKHIGRTFRQP